MWISTRAQYGMRALVEIAVHGTTPVSLKTIAERHAISQPYLEQLFVVLRRAGYVSSKRGAHGGYRIAKSVDAITALEVVELLEGGLAPVACIEDEDTCARTGNCSTEGLWREVDMAVRKVLGATTLADLVAQRAFLQLEPLPESFVTT